MEIDDEAPDLGVPRGEDPDASGADAIWRRRAPVDLDHVPARCRARRLVGAVATAGDEGHGSERDDRARSSSVPTRSFPLDAEARPGDSAGLDALVAGRPLRGHRRVITRTTEAKHVLDPPLPEQRSCMT
jgi:hypothetical protein